MELLGSGDYERSSLAGFIFPLPPVKDAVLFNDFAMGEVGGQASSAGSCSRSA